MDRIEELYRHIEMLPQHIQGVRGKWIKASEHTRWYDGDFPGNDDERDGGRKWNRRILDYSHQNGGIQIYQRGLKPENWFVLAEFADEFMETYQDAHLL